LKAYKPQASSTTKETPADSKSAGVLVLEVYGFVDEYGDRWHWDAGQIVRNPFAVEMLIRREAPIESCPEA
jgi:hypothetical protein